MVGKFWRTKLSIAICPTPTYAGTKIKEVLDVFVFIRLNIVGAVLIEQKYGSYMCPLDDS